MVLVVGTIKDVADTMGRIDTKGGRLTPYEGTGMAKISRINNAIHVAKPTFTSLVSRTFADLFLVTCSYSKLVNRLSSNVMGFAFLAQTTVAVGGYAFHTQTSFMPT